MFVFISILWSPTFNVVGNTDTIFMRGGSHLLFARLTSRVGQPKTAFCCFSCKHSDTRWQPIPTALVLAQSFKAMQKAAEHQTCAGGAIGLH